MQFTTIVSSLEFIIRDASGTKRITIGYSDKDVHFFVQLLDACQISRSQLV